MVSGVCVMSDVERIGYPWKGAIHSWSRVCDEILLVFGSHEEAMGYQDQVNLIGKQIASEGRDCPVLIRSVEVGNMDGQGRGALLMAGICLASNPDWVMLLEADYFISPPQAKSLRDSLLGSKDKEIVLANAVTLGTTAETMLYVPDFERSFPPRNGYSYYRPIGCRPKCGVFPSFFAGVDRRNILTNIEGMIRLQPGKWGDTFNTKFMGHNPLGFALLDTDVVFEHLMFTRRGKFLQERLRHPYWSANEITPTKLFNGKPYLQRYPELDRIKDDYAQVAKELSL